MPGGASVAGKILLACGLAAVAAFIAVGAFVWKRPLTVDAWFSRGALGKSGLERTEVPVSFGEVTVWEGGSGPTVVLLHGAGDQAGTWARAVTRLVGRYRLLIPDLAGHGASDPAEGPIHMAQIVEGVAAVLSARSPDSPVVLVGNSLGAWTAMVVAREHPQRVARVVAVNGGAITGASEHSLFPEDREQAARLMAALTGPDTPQPPGWVLDDVVRVSKVGPLARFAATASEYGPFLLDGRLHEVPVPVDLLWGEADEVMPLAYAERLREGLPAARLTVLPRCGHVPQRECPVAFSERLVELLGAPAPAPPAEEAPTQGEDA